MIFCVQINNHNYKINGSEPIEIAIPLLFNGAQPNAYGVEKATSKPCEAGELSGDTRRGGSCNFVQHTFIPHCNGTHTECVGHLTDERISIHDCLKDSFIGATLITIEPVNALESSETYAIGLSREDRLITKAALKKALKNADENFLQGLIIRTLPNDVSKKQRNYMENLPPFFSTEAIKFIAEKRIKHLLVDMPSIDRTFDEGKLSNHRIFWNVEPESRRINEASRVNNTITEMIFAADSIADGSYLLNLQIAPFAADAAPSRPVLFEMQASS